MVQVLEMGNQHLNTVESALDQKPDINLKFLRMDRFDLCDLSLEQLEKSIVRVLVLPEGERPQYLVVRKESLFGIENHFVFPIVWLGS